MSERFKPIKPLPEDSMGEKDPLEKMVEEAKKTPKDAMKRAGKKKGGKVKKPKKFIYGGVANPAIDQTQAYSSFAQQAPVMEAPAMDAGMSDPMSGYKDGGSVNIGKGKDYIKDLL